MNYELSDITKWITSSLSKHYITIMTMPRRLAKVVFLLGIATFMLLLLPYHQETMIAQRIDGNVKQSRDKNTKYILLWTKTLSGKDLFSQSGKDMFKNCEYSNCFLTYDENLLPSVNQYDAIIFCIQRSLYEDIRPIPSKRSAHQRYIFASSETPVRFFGAKVQYIFNNFYNWTMSYRLDSDIVRTHGYVKKRKTNYKLPTIDYIRNKTKMIAWIVSNCKSTNRRKNLVKRIQKYIPVDIYGACGNLSCPRNAACYDMIERSYKFYLSFENSHCKDYATEKLYGMLKRNIIPVVYGGADYKKIAPPKSVVNIEDFETVKELSNFLKKLAQDERSYLEYLKWKMNYTISKESQQKSACKICEMLNKSDQSTKVYEDINNWWFSKNMSKCKTYQDLPKIVL